MPTILQTPNDSSKTMGLNLTINIKYVCWLNYVLVIMQHLMVLWMELLAFFKHQQHIVEKPLYG